MSTPIRHVHERSFRAPAATVMAWLEELWSGSERDCLPERMHGWRVDGPDGFGVGTRFGHGPFLFTVDRHDESGWRARIDTPGYQGWHGFRLFPTRTADGRRAIRVVHELELRATFVKSATWRWVIGPVHDRCVRLMFAQLAFMLSSPRLVTSGFATPILSADR